MPASSCLSDLLPSPSVLVLLSPPQALVLQKPQLEPWVFWAKDGAELEQWLNDLTAAIDDTRRSPR